MSISPLRTYNPPGIYIEGYDIIHNFERNTKSLKLFIYYNGDRVSLVEEIPDFINDSYLSANSTLIIQKINNNYFILIYEKLKRFLNINNDVYGLREQLQEVLYKYRMSTVNIEPIPEKPKLDPDIKEAIEISEEAQKLQKYTIQKTLEIKKRKVEYFKKYGKFTDKIKAYILNK